MLQNHDLGQLDVYNSNPAASHVATKLPSAGWIKSQTHVTNRVASSTKVKMQLYGSQLRLPTHPKAGNLH